MVVTTILDEINIASFYIRMVALGDGKYIIESIQS